MAAAMSGDEHTLSITRDSKSMLRKTPSVPTWTAVENKMEPILAFRKLTCDIV